MIQSEPTEAMRRRGDKAIAADHDHMIATGANLDWLIAQLACWPERVDEAKTTNDRFLRVSAAATLRATRTDSQSTDAVERRRVAAIASVAVRRALEHNLSSETVSHWTQKVSDEVLVALTPSQSDNGDA